MGDSWVKAEIHCCRAVLASCEGMRIMSSSIGTFKSPASLHDYKSKLSVSWCAFSARIWSWVMVVGTGANDRLPVGAEEGAYWKEDLQCCEYGQKWESDMQIGMGADIKREWGINSQIESFWLCIWVCALLGLKCTRGESLHDCLQRSCFVCQCSQAHNPLETAIFWWFLSAKARIPLYTWQIKNISTTVPTLSHA
jgi:hypothetical protein